MAKGHGREKVLTHGIQKQIYFYVLKYYFVFDKVLWADEKNMYSVAVGWMFCRFLFTLFDL
jgi:hypothetical protein